MLGWMPAFPPGWCLTGWGHRPQLAGGNFGHLRCDRCAASLLWVKLIRRRAKAAAEQAAQGVEAPEPLQLAAEDPAPEEPEAEHPSEDAPTEDPPRPDYQRPPIGRFSAMFCCWPAMAG